MLARKKLAQSGGVSRGDDRHARIGRCENVLRVLGGDLVGDYQLRCKTTRGYLNARGAFVAREQIDIEPCELDRKSVV